MHSVDAGERFENKPLVTLIGDDTVKDKPSKVWCKLSYPPILAPGNKKAMIYDPQSWIRSTRLCKIAFSPVRDSEHFHQRNKPIRIFFDREKSDKNHMDKVGSNDPDGKLSRKG